MSLWRVNWVGRKWKRIWYTLILWWCQHSMTALYERCHGVKNNSSYRLKLWRQVARARRQQLCWFYLDHVDQIFFRERPETFTSRLSLNVGMASKIKWEKLQYYVNIPCYFTVSRYKLIRHDHIIWVYHIRFRRRSYKTMSTYHAISQ